MEIFHSWYKYCSNLFIPVENHYPQLNSNFDAMKMKSELKLLVQLETHWKSSSYKENPTFIHSSFSPLHVSIYCSN